MYVVPAALASASSDSCLRALPPHTHGSVIEAESAVAVERHERRRREVVRADRERRQSRLAPRGLQGGVLRGDARVRSPQIGSGRARPSPRAPPAASSRSSARSPRRDRAAHRAAAPAAHSGASCRARWPRPRSRDVRVEPRQLELRLRHVVERAARRLPGLDRAHDPVDDAPVVDVSVVARGRLGEVRVRVLGRRARRRAPCRPASPPRRWPRGPSTRRGADSEPGAGNVCVTPAMIICASDNDDGVRERDLPDLEHHLGIGQPPLGRRHRAHRADTIGLGLEARAAGENRPDDGRAVDRASRARLRRRRVSRRGPARARGSPARARRPARRRGPGSDGHA